jgi:hypothetical protein
MNETEKKKKKAVLHKVSLDDPVRNQELEDSQN